jgi:hypothetical protein
VVAPVFDGVLVVAGAEIALIAIRAADGAYGKDGVKELLPKSFSSGLVVLVAAAVGTNMRLTEDRHGLLLPFLAGVQYATPDSKIREHLNVGRS